jgi:hypothetical protein
MLRFQPVHYGNSMMSIESAFYYHYMTTYLDFDHRKGVDKECQNSWNGLALWINDNISLVVY